MDKKNRRWLLLISMPAVLVFLIIFLTSIFEAPEQMSPEWYRPIIGPRGQRNIPIHALWASSVLLIVAIVPISYYFISQKLDEKLEKNMKVISKLVNKKDVISKTNLEKTTDKNIILKFLNPNERKVLERLIESKGTVLQSDISRMGGMTKLKTHRAVKDLVRKGIIKTENYGKTNRIILSKDIKEIMLK